MNRFFKADRVRVLVLAICAFGTSPAALAEPDFAAAEAIIAEHSQLPTFTPPGKPFDARTCMAGKKILTIPSSSSIPFAAGITSSMADAGAELGFEVRVWQNQGQPSQYVQGFDYAIQNGYDAVELAAGIVPAGLAPQIAAAKEAGLRVYASHYTDGTLDHDPSVDVSLPISFSRVGEILAAWVVRQTEGKANVLVIGSDDLLPSQPYWKAFEAKLAELCPDCSARYANVTLPEWATRIQTTAQSTLLQDPSINYIVPLFDSMSQFVLPALAITGKRGQIPIASFNGTPFVIDMIQDGEVEMDVGESLGWIARSSLDAYMRDLCQIGDVPDELYVPFYIFDASNADAAGSPAGFDQGYGDAHVAGYRALWGME